MRYIGNVKRTFWRAKQNRWKRRKSLGTENFSFSQVRVRVGQGYSIGQVLCNISLSIQGRFGFPMKWTLTILPHPKQWGRAGKDNLLLVWWLKQGWSVSIASQLKQWAGLLIKKVPCSPFPIQLERESITLRKDFQTKTDFFQSTLFKCIASFVGRSEVCRKGSKMCHDLQLLDFFVEQRGTGWADKKTRGGTLHQHQTLTE